MLELFTGYVDDDDVLQTSAGESLTHLDTGVGAGSGGFEGLRNLPRARYQQHDSGSGGLFTSVTNNSGLQFYSSWVCDTRRGTKWLYF